MLAAPHVGLAGDGRSGGGVPTDQIITTDSASLTRGSHFRSDVASAMSPIVLAVPRVDTSAIGRYNRGPRSGLVTRVSPSGWMIEPRRNMATMPLYPAALRADPAGADLGRAAAGDGPAQADRRGVGLRRELGDLRLSRQGQRGQRGPARRDDAARPGPNPAHRAAGRRRLGRATSSRSWSSSSTRTRTSRSRSTPTTRRAAGWPATTARPRAWVILAAEPGSLIYAGLKAGVGPGGSRRGDRSGEVEPLLHRFEARPGDSILIEAGTVHAIGAGVLLAEIQQMSDATFRVYRLEPRGPRRQAATTPHPRGAGVDRLPSRAGQSDRTHSRGDRRVGTRERLARSQYFALERLRIHGATTVGQSRPVHDSHGIGGELRSEPGRAARPARLRPNAALAGGSGNLRDHSARRGRRADLRRPLSERAGTDNRRRKLVGNSRPMDRQDRGRIE